jgi:hypothetical protein
MFGSIARHRPPRQATEDFRSASAGLVATFFDEDAVVDNPGRMSFTDGADSAVGNASGFDDFQDGHGCEEDWTPKNLRGAGSFVMVR